MVAEHILACLARIFYKLRPCSAAVTGGVAIDVHLSRAGYQRRSAGHDVDILATELESVPPAVASEFLVSHYHVPTAGNSKFLVQLADPITRCRVDIFPDRVGSVSRAESNALNGTHYPIVRAEEILAHKADLLRTATQSSPIDPKHLIDAQLLAAVLGLPVPSIPTEHLRPVQYRIVISKQCPRCEVSRSPCFPLAPKREILEVLGYV